MGDFLTELWRNSSDQPVARVAVLSGLLFLGFGFVISFLSAIGFSEEIKARKWLVLVITVVGSIIVAIGSLLWSGIWVVAAVILVVGVSMRLALKSPRFKEWAQRNYERLMTKLRALGRWLSSYWQWMFALLLPPGVVIAGLLWLPRILWPLILVVLVLALANALFALWLHSVSCHKKILREQLSDLSEENEVVETFEEDFQSLDNWQFQGEWSIEDGAEKVLRVTDSGVGGIAKPCLTWMDYIFDWTLAKITLTTQIRSLVDHVKACESARCSIQFELG